MKWGFGLRLQIPVYFITNGFDSSSDLRTRGPCQSVSEFMISSVVVDSLVLVAVSLVQFQHSSHQCTASSSSHRQSVVSPHHQSSWVVVFLFFFLDFCLPSQLVTCPIEWFLISFIQRVATRRAGRILPSSSSFFLFPPRQSSRDGFDSVQPAVSVTATAALLRAFQYRQQLFRRAWQTAVHPLSLQHRQLLFRRAIQTVAHPLSVRPLRSYQSSLQFSFSSVQLLVLVSSVQLSFSSVQFMALVSLVQFSSVQFSSAYGISQFSISQFGVSQLSIS